MNENLIPHHVKQDFLAALRNRNNVLRQEDHMNLLHPDDLRVQLAPDPSGGVFISIVNTKGETQIPSEYLHVGPLAPLLRTMCELNGSDGMTFSWTEAGDENTYSTRDYPFLATYLHDCENLLVNASMQELTVIEDEVSVTFRITTVESSEDASPSELHGIYFAGDKPVECFISGEYALAGDEMLTIKNIGARFADSASFIEPFDANLLESFLSIFFTDMENVNVDYGERKVKFIDEPVEMTPILIFEKIEEDNSLILRVSESVGNIPMEICENFRLNCFVNVTDNHIYVRHIGQSSIPESINTVMDSICEHLPKRSRREVWNEGNLIAVPTEIASTFLYNSFAALLPKFKILGADKLKTYKIVAGIPKLDLRLGSGIDFLEGKASVDIAGEKFTVSDLLSQYSRHRYITLSDGNRAVMDAGYMRRLGRIFRNGSTNGEDIKVSFFDLPDVMELLTDSGEQPKAPAVYKKFYEGFNSLGKKNVSTPGLKAKLRNYQKAGLRWIDYMYKSNMGGCLADDMGLGKTVQTIAMLTRSVPQAEEPTLIVMPPSLIFNWIEEFKKFAPNIKVTPYYGADRNLKETLKAEVILTSYPLVRNDIEELMKHTFDYIILDESQNIKNVDAQVTKAVWLLKGKHRLAISGTPIENNLTELYSLFRFLNPTMFGSIQEFNNQYVVPIQREADDDAAAALRRKVFPFILRRLKKDVLTDLPERTEQVLSVEMSPRQAKLYEERRAYFAARIEESRALHKANNSSFEILQALGELRQIASVPETKSDGRISSPKIEILVEYLQNAVHNGHKVLAFFNFLAGIELTSEHLDKAGIGYETMTGATRDRQRVVERFQNDPSCQVMLMTVKTGGVGLNLTAADTVFIVEPWWNKAAEEQAINRLHRIGQKNSVSCYYLITADTIEQKIRLLQEKKSALVDAVISSDTGGKTLTDEDIEYLLS
ncbi:MAG: SNF2-related protein [Muribaculaceae bacterium]|nr:SNF2-related protein [Muribaculaceae bacterium]